MHGDVFRYAMIVCVLNSCVAGTGHTAGACGGTGGRAARGACVCVVQGSGVRDMYRMVRSR